MDQIVAAMAAMIENGGELESSRLVVSRDYIAIKTLRGGRWVTSAKCYNGR